MSAKGGDISERMKLWKTKTVQNISIKDTVMIKFISGYVFTVVFLFLSFYKIINIENVHFESIFN